MPLPINESPFFFYKEVFYYLFLAAVYKEKRFYYRLHRNTKKEKKGAVKYKQEKEKSKFTDESYIEETSTSKANILAETVDFAYEGMSNTRDRWIKVI